VNENTRLSTARFEVGITEVLRQLGECQKNMEFVQTKIVVALAEWALAKMGHRRNRYLSCAIQDFVVQATKLMVDKHLKAAQAVIETSLVVPRRLPGSNPSRYQLLTHPTNLLQIKDDYEALCTRIKKLKAENKASTMAFRRELKKILNGCDQDWINDVKLSEEPSDIATLYLTKKHRRLGIGPEMLKKRLVELRDYLGSPNIKKRARLLKLINELAGSSSR